MKKILTAILVVTVLLSLGMSAFAENVSFKGLGIKIPDEVMELINKADVNELAGMVKTYLEMVRGMSDEEIFTYTKEFCEKYKVQLTDAQLKSLVGYVKKAVDFDTQQIKDEIESVKKKVGLFAKILGFLKKLAISIVNGIVAIFKAIFSIFSTAYAIA